ncbi:MAG: hypothetical protein V3U43_08700, partial [Pseudomonadales bacterium]
MLVSSAMRISVTLVKRQRRAPGWLGDRQNQVSARYVFGESHNVLAGLQANHFSSVKCTTIDRDGLGSTGGEPAVWPWSDQLEGMPVASRALELTSDDEYRGSVGLVVIGPEAPDLNGELIEPKGLDEKLDVFVSKLLDQMLLIDFGTLCGEMP